jgi:carboxyl-terminal processing protease
VNNTTKTILGLFVVGILMGGAFSGGLIVGHFMPRGNQMPVFGDLIPSAPAVEPEQDAATPSELQTLFVPFWEAWNLVHEQFVEQPVDDELLMQGAIRGMMEALGDDYTYYMAPQEFEDEVTFLRGEYEGIGAYVDTEGDYLTIISPIEGSPAAAAGLRPGDKVIAIDGEDMTGVTPGEARLKVLGPEGTDVILTVAREGEPEPLRFTITRAKITIRSAEGRMLENNIAYVDINTFGELTTRELDETLNTLLPQNPSGIIIDLRNNGGGYLSTAVEVSSEFIEDGVILYQEYADGRRDTHTALDSVQATDLPLVVLVNEGSASASEILAGALQDYDRATLVGVKTFGKGSVQIPQPLSNNQGAARVTIARWLTPNERLIDDLGLMPDVVVETDVEDFESEEDPQLDAAVETMLAILNGNPIPTSQPTSIPAPTVTAIP